MDSMSAIVLAAGKGTRMRSELPKVLHRVAGKYMIEYVLDAVSQAGIDRQIVVIGHGAEAVKEALGPGLSYVLQEEQLGTGHAVLQTRGLARSRSVMVVCGDTPLINSATLEKLASHHLGSGAAATVLTAVLPDASGYGRVIRDDQNRVARIVEEKDASPADKTIREINTGIYCFEVNDLFEALVSIRPDNAQGEYYLTDVLSVFRSKGLPVEAVMATEPVETLGINSRAQLAEVEKIIRRQINARIMEAGVSIIDPGSTFIDAGVDIGRDTIILPFTLIGGATRIGSSCRIGPQTSISGSVLGEGVTVLYSVILDSIIDDACQIGPFAYLRPETRLMNGVKIGDFVEIKKSTIGVGSKVPHLSYIGDTTIGEKVNIGAGTITCNYDGYAKWPTDIGDGAFIGSNTNMVAPVKVGAGAIIGAGSTINHDVPPGALAVARAPQKNLPNWAEKKRSTKEHHENLSNRGGNGTEEQKK
ncbi:MAG: bifunctional UDP-N-acetylglucosamine diphosphorylase/glucosamine-1-phosphate N-acetyltransferase GlmU [Bacillota bacterium]